MRLFLDNAGSGMRTTLGKCNYRQEDHILLKKVRLTTQIQQFCLDLLGEGGSAHTYKQNIINQQLLWTNA